MLQEGDIALAAIHETERSGMPQSYTFFKGEAAFMSDELSFLRHHNLDPAKQAELSAAIQSAERMAANAP